MTLIINVPGANSPYAVGLVPAVSRKLRGYWRLGSSAGGAASFRNLWRGATEVPLFVGTPVFSTAYATFKSQTNYLETSLPETDAFTVYAVARSTDTLANAAGRPAFAGNYGFSVPQGYPATAFGVTLFLSATTGLPQGTLQAGSALTVSGAPSQSNISLSLADASAWRMLAIKQRADGTKTLRDLSAGTSTVSAVTGTRFKNTSATIRGGSFNSTSNQGLGDMATLIVHEDYMSDAEDALVYAAEKYRLGLLGITI